MVGYVELVYLMGLGWAIKMKYQQTLKVLSVMTDKQVLLYVNFRRCAA